MNILQMFSYPFMQRALIAGVLVSLCAALLVLPAADGQPSPLEQ